VNLTITLAGHAADWRFRDSAALDAWMAAAPWLSRGEVRVVRIGSAEAAPDFLAALARAVRGHDAGRSGVTFYPVAADALSAGFPAALAEALEVPVGGLNRFELLRQTARRLAGHPGVVLVPPAPAGEGAPSRLVEEATDWLDRLRRAEAGVQVAVLLLDTPRQRLQGKVFDLSVGLPVDRLLRGPGVAAPAMWRGYLHYRLAWESAGDPEWAAASEAAARALPVGADADFERLLNDAALAAYEALPGARRLEARQYLEERLKAAKPRSWLAQRAADLEQDRLLWRPFGAGQPLAAAWLARALLLNRAAEVCDFHLRDCLVCAPLAHELLGRCFDLESQERSALWARRSDRAPPDRAGERFGAFRVSASLSAGLYPPGCPALPVDPWPFATFGEFLSVMAADDPRRDTWYDLLNLRNHVAHGHYVSWAAVEKLREIEERLAA
jgi:hypothetical protein